eukprot:1436653-Prymnesium_polylepis.1
MRREAVSIARPVPSAQVVGGQVYLSNRTFFERNIAGGSGSSINLVFPGTLDYTFPAPPGRYLFVRTGNTFLLADGAEDSDFPYPCPAGIIGGFNADVQRSPACSRPCDGGRYCPPATTQSQPCPVGYYVRQGHNRAVTLPGCSFPCVVCGAPQRRRFLSLAHPAPTRPPTASPPGVGARSVRWATRARWPLPCPTNALPAGTAAHLDRRIANALARASKDTTVRKAVPATRPVSAVSAPAGLENTRTTPKSWPWRSHALPIAQPHLPCANVPRSAGKVQSRQRSDAAFVGAPVPAVRDQQRCTEWLRDVQHVRRRLLPPVQLLPREGLQALQHWRGCDPRRHVSIGRHDRDAKFDARLLASFQPDPPDV